MNDRRFIELLNLYVDQQISAQEAAELEGAVLSDAQRREIYQDYCRMQRACSLMGERSRSLAPASFEFERSMREVERKMATPRRPVWSGAYAGMFVGTAMAACVALVVMNRQNRSSAANAEALVKTATVVAVSPPQVKANEGSLVAAVRNPASASSRFEFQPMFAASNLTVARGTREVDVSTERAPLEWMEKVALTPVQPVVVDDQTFETRSTLQPDNRVFRGRHAVQGNAEFTAFQFQR